MPGRRRWPGRVRGWLPLRRRPPRPHRAGLYLLWPSFFTNVTDSYRLSRAGRLCTDLGGLYFNLLSILALAGAYAATGAEVLLLAIAAIHLQMLEQLLPFARFDGYWILADLIGVPDLFARVTPILTSTLTRGARPPDPRITGMRRGARAAVTAWVLCLLPVLAALSGYLLLHLPAILTAAAGVTALALYWTAQNQFRGW